ncbi:hypothetical protein LWC35_17920 [Pseudonocardia kujensis]|uniref:hypothetical protein n=1 Tax=Pseudonocardia kujensis TaxID=1128675 RepID=UPI001E35276E|nr:hypothetical protein [Pseudonocardia kujensis]MCE0764771.1 hypothetical protein [Pseudonocardia kujensis]
MPDNPHLASLQPYLELHKADIADLREQADVLREMLRRPPPADAPKSPLSPSILESDLKSVERSISTHERLIRLGRDERVGEVLQAVADDPELAREAAVDPRAFAARRGLELPDTFVIKMVVAGRDVSARINNLDPDVPFEITWTQDGFQAPPESV